MAATDSQQKKPASLQISETLSRLDSQKVAKLRMWHEFALECISADLESRELVAFASTSRALLEQVKRIARIRTTCCLCYSCYGCRHTAQSLLEAGWTQLTSISIRDCDWTVARLRGQHWPIVKTLVVHGFIHDADLHVSCWASVFPNLTSLSVRVDPIDSYAAKDDAPVPVFDVRPLAHLRELFYEDRLFRTLRTLRVPESLQSLDGTFSLADPRSVATHIESLAFLESSSAERLLDLSLDWPKLTTLRLCVTFKVYPTLDARQFPKLTSLATQSDTFQPALSLPGLCQLHLGCYDRKSVLITACPALQRLRVDCTSFVGVLMALSEPAQTLRELSLHFSHAGNQLLMLCFKFPLLEALELFATSTFNNRVALRWLTPTCFPSLTKLGFVDVQVERYPKKALPSLRHLAFESRLKTPSWLDPCFIASALLPSTLASFTSQSLMQDEVLTEIVLRSPNLRFLKFTSSDPDHQRELALQHVHRKNCSILVDRQQPSIK